MTTHKGLIFVHIPKTAGSTIHGVIAREYWSHKHLKASKIPSKEAFKELPQEERYRYTANAEHIDVSVIPFIRPGLPIITFLRDPSRRVISGYEFIYNFKWHKFHKKMLEHRYSLYDFLDGKYMKNYDNGQVRFLSGSIDKEFGTINETDLELAKHNLDHLITAFGITERFDESILHFSEILNWKTPLYTKINANKNKGYSSEHYELDAKTLAKINECNYYDEQLYQYALEKFDAIIRSKGERFTHELAEFKKKNQRHPFFFKLKDYVLRVRYQYITLRRR
ncbi:MAG: hypothetical protein K0R51_1795 [Cytophagaceae bacterium]|jgi:tetratricopeptide (TPR) repeat protein|nr:hypothetical protein [Cytophagaceae bacterium]